MKRILLLMAVLAGLTACGGGNTDLTKTKQDEMPAIGGLYEQKFVLVERQCDAPVALDSVGTDWFVIVRQDVGDQGELLPDFTMKIANQNGAGWYDWLKSAVDVKNNDEFYIGNELATIDPNAMTFGYNGQFIDRDFAGGPIDYMQGFLGWRYSKDYCMADDGSPGYIVLAMAGPKVFMDESEQVSRTPRLESPDSRGTRGLQAEAPRSASGVVRPMRGRRTRAAPAFFLQAINHRRQPVCAFYA